MQDLRSKWEIIYEHLKQYQIGDVVTDESLQDLLPEMCKDGICTAFHRAAKEMLQRDLRAFERVRLIGYRMVESREQGRLALNQYTKAKRRIKASKDLVVHVDQGRLTWDERRRLDLIEDHLSKQQAMMRRLNERQLKSEERIAVNEKEVLAQEDRLSRVEEILRRHGIGADDER